MVVSIIGHDETGLKLITSKTFFYGMNGALLLVTEPNFLKISANENYVAGYDGKNIYMFKTKPLQLLWKKEVGKSWGVTIEKMSLSKELIAVPYGMSVEILNVEGQRILDISLSLPKNSEVARVRFSNDEKKIIIITEKDIHLYKISWVK
jgi:hypothetical protein